VTHRAAPRFHFPDAAEDAHAAVRCVREAAPVTHVSADDSPFLLIHGDGDKTAPYSQSEAMEAALKNAGVAVKLVRVPGGDHGSDFPGNTQKMDWPAMTLEWFDGHLKVIGRTASR
jgi:dipeptidyl aminopeptidase/acylaminoacyl peptidase